MKTFIVKTKPKILKGFLSSNKTDKALKNSM